ncbi:hypothetical protein ABD74_23810 [Brevibacillus laterosporus]|nr:hypothetical protein [Brevibacillus laterosporus]
MIFKPGSWPTYEKANLGDKQAKRDHTWQSQIKNCIFYAYPKKELIVVNIKNARIWEFERLNYHIRIITVVELGLVIKQVTPNRLLIVYLFFSIVL